MIRTIAASIRHALTSPGFFLGAGGTVFVILLASVQNIVTALRSEELLAYGFHDTLISGALRSNAMALALPILCALPYTAAFVDDIKSGFIKEYLPRTTVNGYLWGKGVACALSGGLALALGILAFYLFCVLTFLPMEAAPAKGAEAPVYFGQLMGSVLLYFCSGAFWSMTGLAFSTLTNSKYMAYASPFVLYYVLIILNERYFDKLFVLYPKEWVSPSDVWMFGNVGVMLLLLELTTLMGLCFAIAAKRRLSQI